MIQKISKQTSKVEYFAQVRLTSLLNTFKTYLEHESVNLIARFKLFDLNSNGWIQIKDWSNVISDFLKKEKHLDLEAKHLVVLKDYLVQCDETKQLANYALMFEKSIKSSNRHIYQYLNDIFSLIDTDHNGYVGVLEAKKVIEQKLEFFIHNIPLFQCAFHKIQPKP